jgi:hypothetical protein
VSTVSVGGIVALTVSVTLAIGCESLLGIDEQYVVEPTPPTGGASSASGGAAGGVLGGPGSGGLLPSTGGAPPVGSGGALPPPEDAGCDGTCGESVVCRPGHYEGTFLGRHDPVGLAGISSFDVSGAIEFDVEANSKGLLAVSGALALAQPASLVTRFKATIEGGLDCGKAKLDAKLTGGELVLALLPAFAFEGKVAGSFDSTTQTVSGDWTENQIPATQATGSGTWTAVWVPR